jgi:enoyl-CoA hydratase
MCGDRALALFPRHMHGGNRALPYGFGNKECQRKRPAMYETILVDKTADGIATLTFNRPEKLNAMTLQMRCEVAEAIDALEKDADVRVLILTGAGKAFSAGLDLSEWSTPHRAGGAYIANPVYAIEQFTGPVIGAINGYAITGGLEVAMACDILIASSVAGFADTHVHVGLLPGWGGSVRMARRIGLPRAKELALTGRFISAKEALAWGLINSVVAAEDLLPSAHRLADEMLAGVPATTKAYKRLLNEEYERTLSDALVVERLASISNNVDVTRAQIDHYRELMRVRRTKKM